MIFIQGGMCVAVGVDVSAMASCAPAFAARKNTANSTNNNQTNVTNLSVLTFLITASILRIRQIPAYFQQIAD
jgi:hypothetical protein